MGRYEVLPFKADHYVEAIGDLYPWMDARAVGRGMEDTGPAYTGLVDGAVAVCAGVLIPWPGSGHTWGHVTALGRRHGYFVHSAVTRYLRAIVADFRLIRLNADAVATCGPARHWIEMLAPESGPRRDPIVRCSCGCGGLARGQFRLESVMPAYGPQGEDFVRYRWIRPGS